MAARKKTTSSNPFLQLLADTSRELEPRLSAVLDASRERSATYGAEVAHMVGAVQSLCERGGKRLRPGLCVVGALAADAEFDVSPAIDAGVSLELLQAYFLIHDDWMDQDAERRGGPTAHVSLAKIFRSKELGERSAILAGDHAVALASAHLASLAIPKGRLQKAFVEFAEMQVAAVAGQQVDIIGRTENPELTYELKTASYTVKGPLLLGAVIAGASKKTLAALDAYSLPTGIGFQLRDDLIGVFGETKHTGKPQGGDLKEGKNTSLVQSAKALLTKKEQKPLLSVLGNRRASPAQVQKAIALLQDCGARQAVEDRIEELKTEALHHITSSAVTPKARRLLTGAVVALVDRTM